MESLDGVRNVDIQLYSSIQHPGQEKEEFDIQLTGQLINKKDKYFLKYDEIQNGNQIKTIIKLDGEDALIMRSGAVTMRLPFMVGSKRAGEYGSGPASFNLLVETHMLAIEEGQFRVHYGLHTENELLGTYELTITYTEGK